MGALVAPIRNDRRYPEVAARSPDEHDRPLQLVARSLAFVDPLSAIKRPFESGIVLWMGLEAALRPTLEGRSIQAASIACGSASRERQVFTNILLAILLTPDWLTVASPSGAEDIPHHTQGANMGRSKGLNTAVLLILAACQGPGLDRKLEQDSKPSQAARISDDDELDEMEANLSKGMPYADLRRLLIEAGWKPVVDTQCKANAIGEDHEKVCAQKPHRAYCSICDRLPELSACSSDGYCGMKFMHERTSLRISTYGEIDDWNVSGKNSGLIVTGWAPER